MSLSCENFWDMEGGFTFYPYKGLAVKLNVSALALFFLPNKILFDLCKRYVYIFNFIGTTFIQECNK